MTASVLKQDSRLDLVVTQPKTWRILVVAFVVVGYVAVVVVSTVKLWFGDEMSVAAHWPSTYLYKRSFEPFFVRLDLVVTQPKTWRIFVVVFVVVVGYVVVVVFSTVKLLFSDEISVGVHRLSSSSAAHGSESPWNDTEQQGQMSSGALRRGERRITARWSRHRRTR